MKSSALRVPAGAGEAARQELAARGALRHDLRIRREGDEILLPTVAGVAPPDGMGVLTEADFEPRARKVPATYQELLDWDRSEKALLPRSFDVVGDVVLVRIPEALVSRRAEIGEALLRFVPGTRVVGSDRGVHGDDRRRSIERIAGTGGWSTQHRENGLSFDVDLELAYFSPRLAREHELVARTMAEGGRAYDLCCGVGPFAVTAAARGKVDSVTAVDANPSAIRLLQSTVRRLALEGRVVPVLARVEEFVRDAPQVETVILNLPTEGGKYAAVAASVVAPGGRLYYYEVVAKGEAPRRGAELSGRFSSEGGWTVESQHVVHPYSPTADLVSFLFRRGGLGEHHARDRRPRRSL